MLIGQICHQKGVAEKNEKILLCLIHIYTLFINGSIFIFKVTFSLLFMGFKMCFP